MERDNYEDVELGFGRGLSNERQRRLVNKDGTFNVARQGTGFFSSISLYQSFVTMRWSYFLAMATAAYLVLNVGFALVYCGLGPEALTGAKEAPFADRFLHAFFFSVQTATTIGYGHLAPKTPAADIVVTVESFVGLASFAIFTGLLFARFSRPKAKIRYSSLAVVGPYRGDGGDTAFMFRIANQRRNQLLELKAKLYYSWTIQTDRGPERSYARLLLERDDISFFPLSWTVVHPIGEESPLFGQTAEDLIENDCEFVVLLTGIDDTFHQLVHSIHSYKGDEIQFGRKFRRIATRDEPGRYVTIDLSRLDETE